MKNKKGVTLVEVTVAVLIFIVAAVPLYYAVSYGSKEEIQLDKVAQANKILASFKEECTNLDYEIVSGFVPSIEDASGMTPNSFKDMLEAQKKYKDFKFHADIKANTLGDFETLEIEAEVTWTRDGGGKSSQRLSFVKVKK